MQFPAIYLGDPVELDYHDFIQDAFTTLGPGIGSLDVIWGATPLDSSVFSAALTKAYSIVRHYASKANHDYAFEVNVIFDLQAAAIARDSCRWSVVLKPDTEPLPFEIDCRVANSSVQGVKRPIQTDSAASYSAKSFDVVASGGTFDHLHDGHKILLSVSAWLARAKLIIGITGPELLKNKRFAELIQPFDVRLQTVSKFLNLILPLTHSEMYEFSDVCGPTGYIKDIDALVVSCETEKGGAFVNESRAKFAFPSLSIVSIDVTGSSNASKDNNWQGKLSSTGIREQILKRRLHS